MIVQWIYNSWRFLWHLSLSLLMLLLLLTGITLIALQTTPVQERVAQELETRFNDRFQGRLRIGSLEGTLPLDIRLNDVQISLPADSASAPLLQAESIYLRIDISESIFERLTLSRIELHQPQIRMKFLESGIYDLPQAFALRKSQAASGERNFDPRRLPELNVLAIEIDDGELHIDGFPERFQAEEGPVQLPSSLRIEQLSMLTDVQFSGQQQFVNISRLSADIPDLDMQEFRFSGQFYADERFVELNRFNLNTGSSMMRGNISFEGIQYLGNTLRQQLEDKSIRLRLDESRLLPDEFRDILPGLPAIGQPLVLNGELRYEDGGAVLERLEADYGQSAIILNGEIARLFELEEYRLEIETARLFQDDVRRLGPEAARFSFADMGLLNLEARISGGRDSLEALIDLRPPTGTIRLEAEAALQPPYAYSLIADVEALDLGAFSNAGFSANDRLNSRLELSGRNFTLKEARSQLRLAVYESQLGPLRLEQLQFSADLIDGFLEPNLKLLSGEGSIEAEGWIDLLAREPRINMDGRSRGLNLARLLDTEAMPSSRLNTNFSLTASGTQLDRYAGEFYLNAYDSDFADQYIKEQEFMFSLNDADASERQLSIGGSLLEADITSSMKPSEIIDTARLWAGEIAKTAENVSYYELDQLEQVVGIPTASARKTRDISALLEEEQRIDIRAQVDDLTLLSKLFKEMPAISTIANIDASITMKNNELHAETNILADFLTTGAIVADSLIFRTQASYTPGQRVDFFSGNTRLDFASLEVSGIPFERGNIHLDAYDEAVVLQQLRVFTGEDVELGAMASAVFSRQDVDIRIMDFFIGDEDYVWQNIDQTPITLDSRGRVHVERLEFGNLQERFIVDGTFSEDPQDSVSYLVSGLELERISQLIGGEVNFSGILDGTFFTRSLRSDPTFLGDLSINELRLNQNLAGDLQFSSRFDSEARLFDTRLRLSTDEETYSAYLEQPENSGQDILIEGVVRTLGSIEDAQEELPLVDLNLDVRNVDLWFLPLILNNIFTDAGGQGTGTGSFEVLRDGSIRYDSEFDVRNGRLRPVFLDAPMQVSGNLNIDSENGAVFNDMSVRDSGNGTGTLSGQVDFGIGGAETFFDLQLSMQNLRFMDNSNGPDMPFFGTGIGSGTIQLTGSSNAPYISTPSPVRMSPDSNMNIPLDAEENVESGSRFIQFVDTFDQSYEDLYFGNFNNRTNGEETEEVDLTFMEKFEFDLRFDANEAMSVRLIFDEVTSEVLSATGTGRIRLALQDEVFQVFGQFDVEGGDYLFVGGDLFARRFSIREGGSITWEGDPVNATIDVEAAYRARPDVNQLRGTVSADAAPVRVPVDLILHITGTLESVENEFYFEFPSGTDVTQTATLAATLNSEDTKLLQATSILLTGNFVPADTGLNNLFTSQLGAQGIGTLLSSQISSLLNSNLSNLDINLNMTGFDEADLGIALYLFDDRLTLRREGVVTGPNSNIGDFDVTYRINQYLSLEAFHRRESLLPSAVSVGQAQTDESYGVGVEARVQFNTWSELGRRIARPFNAVFGGNGRKQEEDEPETEGSEVADERGARP